MNRFALGIVLALAIAAGGYYLVSSQANVETAGSMAETAKEKAKDMAATASEKAKEVAAKTKEVAAKTTEAAKDAAAKTVEAAKDAAATVSTKAAETVEKAKAKVEEVKNTVVADASEKTDGGEGDAPKMYGPNKDKEWDEGRWVDEDGAPTYNIDGDGQIIKQVDWATYSGWRRYHGECHVCHGPNGDGSTFAPALADSLKTISYEKFLQIVSSGQQNKWGRNNSVMPALGDNKNVMCYIDDIYTYLHARADGVMPAGKLSSSQRAEKPLAAREAENECFGE